MDSFLPDILRDAADRFPEEVAVRAGQLGWTYRELDARADEMAARLEPLNIRGARVGLLLANQPAFPVVLHGLWRAGASVVFLNPLWSPREVRECLADAGVNTVVTRTGLEPLIPAQLRSVVLDEPFDRLQVRGPESGGPSAYGEAVLPAGNAVPSAAEAVVGYTAGYGGWTRGARLSHGNLVANLRATVEAMEVTAEDRVLAVLPLIHLFGLTVTLNAPLAAGACVLPVERFHPVRLLDLVTEERATVIAGVPAIYMGLLSIAERRGVPAHDLRLAICGGAPLPLEVSRHWEEVFGIPLREGYGLTEAAPVCLFNRMDRPNRAGTLGEPFPGVEVTIRDAWGNVLPDGEVGEICVRGANVFLGYLGDEGRSARDFHGDWLRTGDLGSREPGGEVRFRGMIKPMFTRNGFNVYPREIERVLEEDPRIARVVACALPDAAKENEIVLLVEPAPGARLAEQDVRMICSERLASYKQPTRIHIGASLPAN